MLKRIEKQEKKDQVKSEVELTEIKKVDENSNMDLETSISSLSTNDIVSQDGPTKSNRCMDEKGGLDCSKEACLRNKWCRSLTLNP